jgi:hypothetical protein
MEVSCPHSRQQLIQVPPKSAVISDAVRTIPRWLGDLQTMEPPRFRHAGALFTPTLELLHTRTGRLVVRLQRSVVDAFFILNTVY